MELWRWVRYSDLATHLCGLLIIENRKPRRTSPPVSLVGDFLDRFGLLCDHLNGKEVLSWVIEGQRYALRSKIRPDEVYSHALFFPEAFSESVIRLAEQGIVRVTAEPLSAELPKGEDEFIPHDLVAHHIDGGRQKLVPGRRRGTYRLV